MARTDRIRELASRKGWAFSPGADKEFARAWSMLPEIPRQGKIAPLLFVDAPMRGIVREVTVFQHTYTTWAGSSPMVVAHSVYSIDVGESWPDLTIHRRFRGPLGWLANLRASGRAAPTGDASFDARRYVLCRDGAFVRRLVTPALREHLLSREGVMWRVVFGRLCLVYRGKLRPEKMERSLDRLRRFVEAAGVEPGPRA